MNEAKPTSVRFSTLAHATEDLEKVVQAVLAISPPDFPRKVETLRLKGHYGNEITICRLTVNSRQKAEGFIDHLWERLGVSDRKTLYMGLDEHLDSAGTLHLRIEKQKALEGQVVLGSTDPVKVEISFQSRGTGEPLVDLVRKCISMRAEAIEPSSSYGGDGSSQ